MVCNFVFFLLIGDIILELKDALVFCLVFGVCFVLFLCLVLCSKKAMLGY